MFQLFFDMKDDEDLGFHYPIITVIVPVYKVKEYLFSCVCSLQAQTYRNLRIILVDDGSPDECPELCDALANRYANIIVLHRSNGGLSAARNTGLDYLFSLPVDERGEYVAFVDSDDWVEPDYIESMLKTLKECGTDAAQCGHYITYSAKHEEDKNKNHSTTVLNRIQAIESLCRNNLWDVTAWNKLYRLDLFECVRYPEGLLYEDTATTYRITQLCNKVAVNMAPKYHYVQRYSSIANGTIWTDNKLDFIHVGDQMADWVKVNYPQLVNAAIEKQAFVRLSTLSQIANTRYNNVDIIKQLRNEILKFAPIVLRDPKASKRDKLGILALIPGYWCYRAIWKCYYVIKRNRSTTDI